MEIKEPTMLVVDVFPTPALALKSFMFAQLDRKQWYKLSASYFSR